MKHIFKHDNLPWLTLLCGGIGLLLRLWLESTENAKGFITRWHISEILLVALTVLLLGFLFLVTRSLVEGNKYAFNYPPSAVGGIGPWAAALGIGITAVTELAVADTTLKLCCWLAALPAAVALLLVGLYRWRGQQPTMIFHGYTCCWLILLLICQYRTWSSDPQLEDYAFRLLALVFTMISVYHRATFDENIGRRDLHAFFSLASVYCCAVSLVGDGMLLYLALGIWQLLDLCRLTPMPRQFRQKRAPQPNRKDAP